MAASGEMNMDWLEDESFRRWLEAAIVGLIFMAGWFFALGFLEFFR